MPRDRDDWLYEEYRLLSEHYFHEDNTLNKHFDVYTLINAGLVSFVASNAFGSQPAFGVVIPALGLIICLSWLAVMVRMRAWRNYISHRIKKIEAHLHTRWEAEGDLVRGDLRPLDIKTMTDWDRLHSHSRWSLLGLLSKTLRDVPSSIALLAVPVAFGVAWAVILTLSL